jgi:hypothetical protein
MGRTLRSISQEFHREREAYAKFRRALSRRDQLALDEVFSQAQVHLAEAAYAAHALPMEVFLLAMLLEQHRQVLRLRRAVHRLTGVDDTPVPTPPDPEEAADGH